MTALPTPGAVSEKQVLDDRAGKLAVSEVSCDSCFFGRSELCSLPKEEACPTFRPESMVQVRSV